MAEEALVHPRSFEIANDGDEASQINGGQDEVPDGGQEVIQILRKKDEHSQKMTRRRVLDAFLDDLMPSDEEEKVYCSLKNVSIVMEDTGETGQTKDSSVTTEVENIRKSRSAAKLIDYSDDSDDNSEPPSKKSKTESAVKKSKNHRFDKQDYQPEYEGKESDTELECPKCDFSTNSVLSWTDHIRRKHSTTPSLMGVALRCGCGHESRSDKHSRTCKIGKCEVILQSEMAGGSVKHASQSGSKDNDVKLKCPECNFSTTMAQSWVRHLRKAHFTTPTGVGLAIRCGCGHVSLSDRHCRTCKIGKCEVISQSEMHSFAPFKFVKGYIQSRFEDYESDTQLKCPECDFSTNIANSWVQHLKRQHDTTPTQAGLALRCECGREVVSATHSQTCNIAKFTVIRQYEMAAPDTPQCILCEMHPKTATGYLYHLRREHGSTLKANGIYIICSCGLRIVAEKKGGFGDHTKRCDGRDFDVHKLDEE